MDPRPSGPAPPEDYIPLDASDHRRSSRHKRSRSGSRSRSRSPKRHHSHRSSSRRHSGHHSHRSRSKEREPSRRRRSRSGSRSRSKSRSPSPSTIERRRKRSNNWDKPPPGFEGMTAAQIAHTNPQAFLSLVTPPTVPAGVPNPQQQRQAKRLYVGNVPPNVSDAELLQFFNTAMIAAGVTTPGTNPVVAVQLNREKSFAFLEFRTPEDATAGIKFDGITLQGHSLKVRRPKDYTAAPAPVPSGDQPPLIGIVSTNVPDTPNKVFIGGLPAHLNDEQVKELLTSFGPLKSFNLVKDAATGNSKGFAFFEYVDPSVTDAACAGLNGLKMGDKTLLVQRAHLGARTASPPASPPAVSAAGVAPASAGAAFLNLSIPALTLMAPLPKQTTPTRTLVLLNMVTAADLADDGEYDDIFDDVRDEAVKHGRVRNITIPRGPEGTPGVGRIYIEYDTVDDAVRAQAAIAGRRFCGRTVVTAFYDDQRRTAKGQ